MFHDCKFRICVLADIRVPDESHVQIYISNQGSIEGDVIKCHEYFGYVRIQCRAFGLKKRIEKRMIKSPYLPVIILNNTQAYVHTDALQECSRIIPGMRRVFLKAAINYFGASDVTGEFPKDPNAKYALANIKYHGKVLKRINYDRKLFLSQQVRSILGQVEKQNIKKYIEVHDSREFIAVSTVIKNSNIMCNLFGIISSRSLGKTKYIRCDQLK